MELRILTVSGDKEGDADDNSWLARIQKKWQKYMSNNTCCLLVVWKYMELLIYLFPPNQTSVNNTYNMWRHIHIVSNNEWIIILLDDYSFSRNLPVYLHLSHVKYIFVLILHESTR